MRFALCLALVLASTPAAAHIALMVPQSREPGQKTAPCGEAGSVRGTKITTYQPGQTITVEWDETVDHPGHYRIAFDDDGDDSFINPFRSTDNFSFTLVEPIADKVGGHYTQQVTLPLTPCTNCTLQLIQVMTTTEPYNSFYWQCADLVLAGDPILPDGPPGTTGDDAGVSTGEDAGTVIKGGGGGGCSTSSGAGLLVGLTTLLLRRRRR